MKINKAKFLKSVFKRSTKFSVKYKIDKEMIKLLNTLDGEKSVKDILLATGFSATKVGKIIVELYKLGLINFVLQNIQLLSNPDLDYIADTLTRFIGPGSVKLLNNTISNFGFNRFDYPVKLVENLIYRLSLKINDYENRITFKQYCHRFLASKYSIKEALGPFDASIIKKILVVEDSPTTRKVIKMNLQNNGFLVVEADNGIDALSKLAIEQPNLVVLDVMLPKLDGYSVLYMIRHNNELKTTPVLMLTSKAKFTDKVKGKLSSANAYLTKPFDPDNLITEVEKHMK
ncbi:MAG: response regulator [Desulfobacterales bacterium]|nr:response regulator [Desulfobacterales bacterium]